MYIPPEYLLPYDPCPDCGSRAKDNLELDRGWFDGNDNYHQLFHCYSCGQEFECITDAGFPAPTEGHTTPFLKVEPR